MPDEFIPIRSPFRRPLRAFGVPPGPSAAAIPPEIAPEYHWMADPANTVATGGLVDRLLNRGSAGAAADFVQTGAARAPLATDANSNSYLALDGAADFYQAATAGEWAFLYTSPWTVFLVIHRPSPTLVGAEGILDSSATDPAKVGVSIGWTGKDPAAGFGAIGPLAIVDNGSGTKVCSASSYGSQPAIDVWSVSFLGRNTQPAANSFAVDLEVRTRGRVAAFGQRAATSGADSVVSPLTLTLGKYATGTGFTATRIYEVLIVKRALSDRLIAAYEDYARQKYQIAM